MTLRVQRIDVERVTVKFGVHAALRSVSCAFEAGTLTFVQGPNGAGKSTLLSVVATTLRATSGVVRYPPLGADRISARTQIGWVAHESHCYRELTGRENVTLAARLYGVRDGDAVAEVCRRVDASDFFDQPVGTLSRGQRQRVALARALVHSPSILLLDEPLSGLDKGSVEHFDKILAEEQSKGSVVIVVSHRDDWVQRLRGRRILMRRGKIEEEAPAPSTPPASRPGEVQPA